jgi:hypothetical protein
MNTISPEKLALIKELGAQREAAASVPATEGSTAVLAAYRNGETIDSLVQLHELYSAEHGRPFPFYDEDFEWDQDVPELQNAEDGALGSAFYAWNLMQNPNITVGDFALHLSNLSDHVGDLISFHPDYDADYGTLS